MSEKQEISIKEAFNLSSLPNYKLIYNERIVHRIIKESATLYTIIVKLKAGGLFKFAYVPQEELIEVIKNPEE